MRARAPEKFNCFCLSSSSSFFFFFIFATIIPTLTANVAEWDEYWTKRRDDAAQWTQTSSRLLSESRQNDDDNRSPSNSTTNRRELMRYKGPCQAINVIDRCWRCDPHWANNRQAIANCAQGFGRLAKGGKGGEIYVVTDPSDDWQNPQPGTLRYGVIQKRPLWITFGHDMNIQLGRELIMQSDKTIDGRGASVNIANGAGITIQFVRNIIITNIHIHDIVTTSGGMIRDSEDHIGFRTPNEGDGISIFGASDIWIDHISMSKCSDGLIDAVQASTGITISNCHFTDHDKVLLFGASDITEVDKNMKVTVAFNHFGKRLVERMPRCRSGFFHVVNNDYTHWEMYAIGGSHEATIISQGNRFIAPGDDVTNAQYFKEVTHRDAPIAEWSKWTWVSDGDLLMNGAKFVPSGNPDGAQQFAALELIKPAPATQVPALTQASGFLRCVVGKRC